MFVTPERLIFLDTQVPHLDIAHKLFYSDLMPTLCVLLKLFGFIRSCLSTSSSFIFFNFN